MLRIGVIRNPTLKIGSFGVFQWFFTFGLNLGFIWFAPRGIIRLVRFSCRFGVFLIGGFAMYVVSSPCTWFSFSGELLLLSWHGH